MRVPRKKEKDHSTAHCFVSKFQVVIRPMHKRSRGVGGGRACCNKCQWAKKSVPRAPLPPHTGNMCHTPFTHTLLTSDVQWQPTASVTESQQRPLISHFVFLFLARPFEVLSATEVLSEGKAKKQAVAARYDIHHGPPSSAVAARGLVTFETRASTLRGSRLVVRHRGIRLFLSSSCSGCSKQSGWGRRGLNKTKLGRIYTILRVTGRAARSFLKRASTQHLFFAPPFPILSFLSRYGTSTKGGGSGPFLLLCS